MKFIKNFFDLAERPDGFGKKIEEIDGLFAFNYFFASKFIKNKIILDNGCGSGYGTFYLSEKGANKVFGIDYDKKTIERCKKNYKKPNLLFSCMDGTKMSFPDNFFDVVVSFEVIEHLPNYEDYLKECKRVLKKDGFLIISTPNKEKFSPGMKHPIIVCHFKEFTYFEFVKLLRKYFEDVKIYGKNIVSSEYIKMENSRNYKTRISLSMKLASIRWVRKISRFIPVSIRRLATGSVDYKLSLDDIRISRNGVDQAKEFLAVCVKK